ncbi:hypothetical protein F4780DRAFT_524769 [Xylariomycetidae sp. FL0641]|nr:hypothetical protein F4780DRAFT_524769 [Xylariomycetidae sp. FL0641]
MSHIKILDNYLPQLLLRHFDAQGGRSLMSRTMCVVYCNICYSPLAVLQRRVRLNHSWTVLPCGHIFGYNVRAITPYLGFKDMLLTCNPGFKCIKDWFFHNPNPGFVEPACPTCRTRMLHDGCGHTPTLTRRVGGDGRAVTLPTQKLTELCEYCQSKSDAAEHAHSEANQSPESPLQAPPSSQVPLSSPAPPPQAFPSWPAHPPPAPQSQSTPSESPQSQDLTQGNQLKLWQLPSRYAHIPLPRSVPCVGQEAEASRTTIYIAGPWDLPARPTTAGLWPVGMDTPTMSVVPGEMTMAAYGPPREPGRWLLGSHSCIAKGVGGPRQTRRRMHHLRDPNRDRSVCEVLRCSARRRQQRRRLMLLQIQRDIEDSDGYVGPVEEDEHEHEDDDSKCQSENKAEHSSYSQTHNLGAGPYIANTSSTVVDPDGIPIRANGSHSPHCTTSRPSESFGRDL